jgi:hypothetical protein
MDATDAGFPWGRDREGRGDPKRAHDYKVVRIATPPTSPTTSNFL